MQLNKKRQAKVGYVMGSHITNGRYYSVRKDHKVVLFVSGLGVEISL